MDWPGAETTLNCKNTSLVQPASHGLNSDQKNIDLEETFVGAQINLLGKKFYKLLIG